NGGLVVSENPSDDRLLEEFVARRAGIARDYRAAAGEQPPAAVDNAILAAARRAVGSRPRRVGWAVRLGAPLAAAAGIVLAVALTLTLEREPKISRISEPLELKQLPGQSTKAQSRLQSSDDRPVGAPTARKEAGDKRSAVRRVAPAAPPAERDEITASADLRRKQALRPVPQTEVSREMAQTEEVPRQAGAAAPALTEREALSVKQRVQGADAMRAPAAAAALGKTEAVGSLDDAAQVTKSILGRDAWIEKIERLLDAGKTDEAKAELAKFRQHYPEAALPEKLRPLEPKK
ncbi:MAG: hypothetical protein ACREUQ_13230, partial [Burkholderiales bacterium]